MDLCKQSRRQETLYKAWRRIRAKALASDSSGIRTEAKEFEEQAPSRLRSISDRLRAGTFRFAKQHGIPKRRSGKRPRPIVLAPLENRIVHRAMLDTLVAHCPEIREVLDSPRSVGGIEGVDVAIRIVREHMSGNRQWFIRSDIKDFFSNVPRAQVIDFIGRASGDDRFTELFADAVTVELANADQIKDDLDVFPIGEKGVAQGSALSPLVGNIALLAFDRQMNGWGVVCIRYIDDFLLIGPGKEAVLKAFEQGRGILKGMGCDAYHPDDAPEKAGMGLCSEGLSFLGYDLNHSLISPSRKARSVLLEKVCAALYDGQEAISAVLLGDRGRLARQRYAQTLVRVDRIVKGWGEAFAISNNMDVRRELDRKISEHLQSFQRFGAAARRAKGEADARRVLGVQLLQDLEQKSAQPIDHRFDPARSAAVAN